MALDPLRSFTVDPRTGCWLWTRARNSGGYGHLVQCGRHKLAHRVVYELLVGPLQARDFLCHRCDTPACVNPAHLFIGDAKANMRDASDKRRTLFQKRPELTRRERNGRAYLTKEQIRAFHRLRKGGFSYYEIGRGFAIPHSTVHSAVNEHWPELREEANHAG